MRTCQSALIILLLYPVLNYRNHGGTISKQLHRVIPQGRAKRMEILDFHDESIRDPSYIHFNATGLLHYSEGSVVFGIVTPEQISHT